MTLTADTITDEQIRELSRATNDLKVRALCIAATSVPDVLGRGERRRNEARARCAEILNARNTRKL